MPDLTGIQAGSVVVSDSGEVSYLDDNGAVSTNTAAAYIYQLLIADDGSDPTLPPDKAPDPSSFDPNSAKAFKPASVSFDSSGNFTLTPSTVPSNPADIPMAVVAPTTQGNQAKAKLATQLARGLINYLVLNTVVAAASVISTLTVTSLTPNEVVVTDGTSTLASFPYTTAATANTLAERDSSGDLTIAGLHASSIRDSSLSTGIVHSDSSGNFSSSLLVNADVSATAAIDGTKISPNFGAQTIQTTGTIDAATVNVSGLTASQAVVTDASKNLASLGYATSATALTLAERDSSGNLNVVGLNASTQVFTPLVGDVDSISTLTCTATDEIDFQVGTSTNRFVVGSVKNTSSLPLELTDTGSAASTVGSLRLTSSSSFNVRNNAGTGNLNLWSVASDAFTFGDTNTTGQTFNVKTANSIIHQVNSVAYQTISSTGILFGAGTNTPRNVITANSNTTFTVDCSKSNYFQINYSSSFTLASSNLKDGQIVVIFWKHDATSNTYTVTYTGFNQILASGAAMPQPSNATANAKDCFIFQSDGSNLFVISTQKNFS